MLVRQEGSRSKEMMESDSSVVTLKANRVLLLEIRGLEEKCDTRRPFSRPAYGVMKSTIDGTR